MKKYILFGLLFLLPAISNAAVSYSDVVNLSPGWNIVSTPKILDSHSFSLAQTSNNFDVFVLNASSTFGWSTLADLGQTEFTPLFGYFINNKSTSTQTLTFNYKASTTPNERFFERTFTKTGWYSIGVSNPTYSKSVTDDISDTNNPNKILSSLSSGYDSVIDLTDGNYSQNPNSVSVGNIWKQAVAGDINSLNDLRDTKGYVTYITQPDTLYSGFQNDGLPQPSVSITANGNTASTTVYASSSVNISWTSKNVSSCDISPENWSGVSGTKDVVVSTSTTYSISCSGIYGGTATSSVVVNTQNSIAQATLTLSDLFKGNSNIIAGSSNQEIWASKLLLTGPVLLKSLTFKIIGSIPSSSLTNFSLYKDEIKVATTTGIDSNGYVVFDLESNPYNITSSSELELAANIVNGSSRTFNVGLENTSDIQLIDSDYGTEITVGFNDSQTTGTFTIATGTVTVEADSSLVSGNVVTGSSNVALARYIMKAYGEDMKISYLQASSSEKMDNVALYANGVQIGSTRSITATATPVLFSLGSSLIIPAGQTVTLEIRGDIKAGGINALTTGNTIMVALSGYSNNAQGSYAQQLSTVPSSSINGPIMTVVGAGLAVAKNVAYGDQTMPPNTAAVKIGSYILTTNSSEPVRITSLTVTLGGVAGAITNVSNLYVKIDGVSATPVNPQVSNNFSVDFTIPANSSKTIDVYADLGSATGTSSTALSVNGYGVDSNITISSTAVVGQTITVNN